MNGDQKKTLPTLKLPELYKFVDKNYAGMTDILKEAVAIPSLSQEEDHFPDVIKMLKLCQTQMNDLGATTELIEKTNCRTDGGIIFPPVLFGNLFIDEELKTICVYGHIDTFSKSNENGGKANNYELRTTNGRMHGCGISRTKGPLFCWLSALKTYKSTKTPIPVNVKFVVEGTAVIYSPTLDYIAQSKMDFFRDVDCICFTVDKKIDEKPCLRYGYRGICHFSLEISCGNKDIDSSIYGGAFNQPLIDAVHVVSSLMDKYDKLAVPNLMKNVAPLSLVEKNAADAVEMNVEELKEKLGVIRLRHKENASRIVMHKTRLPSISVHGFETTNCTDEKNPAAVPSRTVAKFSIRLVPNQTARETRIHVENHIKKMWNQYKSANDYHLTMDLGIDPWKEDPTDPHFKAAAKAMILVYGKEPLYVCDGYSLPALPIITANCPQRSSLILPLSESDDGHPNDESMSIQNYINGVKVIMAYMCYVHEM